MELPFELLHCWDYTLHILKHQFKRTYATHVHSSVIYSSQVLEATLVPAHQ